MPEHPAPPGGTPREPIALIGIGCRYPGVHGPLSFWDLIRSQRSTVSPPPEHRIALGYDIARYFDPRPRVPGRISSPFAGFLEHPDQFDPAPFGLSPRDVRAMEPQQRLMVEVVWDALVDAGIPPISLRGERVAVMLGHMAEDYSRERIAVLGEENVNRSLDVFTVSGMSRAVLSGRISFLLGVTGPSLTLDTACSSSLIATHLACQSLWSGESRLALAGGVNLFLTPEGNIALSRSGMLAPDGHCKAFDARADGFVRAEGAGVVLLRPLADALAAGDPIYALIRGTGISTDGRDGGHMMAPGRHGQAQAMRDAYAGSGVSPSEIDFVETHGTGTRIGDPVEIAALADVMGPGRPPDRPLRVSSVKGHIGHSESASGVAGLISAALALAQRELPAQLHFREPTPHIPWDEIPVRVQSVHEAWPDRGAPRLAAVNSFGISGTNAHVVLEESPAPRHRVSASRADEFEQPLIFPFSAHDDAALTASLAHTADWLRGDAPPRLVDLAHTLGSRREHHGHRFATQAKNHGELLDELDARLAGRPSAASAGGQSDPHGVHDPLVMVFPGQGAQTRGMGRSLYDGEPAFRTCLDELDAAYSAFTDWSLVDALRDPDRFGTLERLSVLQPTLIAVEIGLAAVWSQWGIRPDIVVGQSLGEIAAAHVAGCLDVASVARLACHRGALVERVAGRGAMALVGLGEDALGDWLRPHAGRLEMAGASSPSSCIVSGDCEPIEALLRALAERDVFARRLDVDFASHCFQMDPLLDDFRARVTGLEPKSGAIPFYSTVEPGPLDGASLDSDYWVRNLRAPVRFRASLERLMADGARRFVEVSPHPTLARAIPETAARLELEVVTIASLVRQRDERASLLAGLAQLYAHGSAVDFARTGPPGRTLRTAPYPYQRRRFWFGSRTRADLPRPSHPLLGLRIDVADAPGRCLWQKTIDPDELPCLDDYRIEARHRLPAAVAVEALLAAACESWPGETLRLRNLALGAPPDLEEARRITLQISLRRVDGGGELALRTRARDGDEWQTLASADVQPLASTGSYERAIAHDTTQTTTAPPPECESTKSPDAWHAALADAGVDFGPRMRSLRESTRREHGLDARLVLPRLLENESHTCFAHPSLLETAWTLGSPDGRPSTPCWIDELLFRAPLEPDIECRVETNADRRGSGGISALVLRGADGRSLIELSGIRTRPIGRAHGANPAARVSLHPLAWRALEAPAIPELANPREWILCGDEQAVSRLASELQKLGSRCHRGETGADDFDMRPDSHGAQGLGFAWLHDASDESRDPISVRGFDAVLSEWLASGVPIEAAWRIRATGATDFDLLADPLRIPSHALPDGLARTDVRLEHGFSHEACSGLAQWLVAGTAEPQLMAREGAWWAARLVAREATTGEPRAAGASRPGLPRSFVARVITPGEPDGFELRESALPEPASGQVRIAVDFAAPTRESIERLLGRPADRADDDGTLCADLVGVVTACGAGVTGLHVGDPVLAAGPLAREVCVDSLSVARLRDERHGPRIAAHARSLACASALLAQHAPPAPTDRVLVHDPDGEYGWATLALIRRAGASALGTADRAEDVAILKALGIPRIDTADRSDWTAAIQQATGGAGVDTLIHYGDRLPISGELAAIRPGGRLLDARRRDRSDPGPVPGMRILDGRSVGGIDPASFARDPRTPWRDRLADAIAWLDSIPHGLPAPRVFPITDLARALRFAAQQRGGGRVVVDFDRADELEIRAADGRRRLFEADSRHVLVCRASDTATRLADWMRARGAGQVESIPRSASGASQLSGSAADAGLRGVVIVDPIGDEGSPEPEWLADAGCFVLWLRGRIDTAAPGRIRARGGDETSIAHWIRARRALGLPVCEVQWFGAWPLDLIEESIEIALTHGAPEGRHVALADPCPERSEPDRGAPLFDEIRDHLDERERRHTLCDEWASLPTSERTARIVTHLGDAVAQVLGMGESDRARVVAGAALADLGLDSLMTLELAVGLHRDLGVELPRGALAPGQSLLRIAESIGGLLGPGAAA